MLWTGRISLLTTLKLWSLFSVTTETAMATVGPTTHYKCRNGFYQQSEVVRQLVTDDKVSWDRVWDEYQPPFYTAQSAINKPWADPVDVTSLSKTDQLRLSWNNLDNKVDRRSHLGFYEIIDGLPRNPVGRTGIRGRGLLGRWGPNHAADPIVTRWKTEDDGEQCKVVLDVETRLPILQFVAIQRKDNKEWAIPGGMVDPGELISKTLQREFEEEALNSLEISDDKMAAVRLQLQLFFTSGTLIYKGYVDDPRNTDNAWMETVAMNFHDEAGSSVGHLRLNAGDDAAQVQWMDVHCKLELFASHSHLLEKTAALLKAHW